MADSAARLHLRRELEAHLTRLGYSCAMKRSALYVPEIVRVSPVRGRMVYGETVLRRDLRSRRCHERLRFFSERRTRRRSSIVFFIGVAQADEPALEALLEQLDIRSHSRGGHVYVVPIAAPQRNQRRGTARAKAG
ncbi:MAG: hypothetical protein HY699_14085 [Deltaproteobacteria bacterium]|nr:hypothetical protein [Deltaproteobacteria bacterium]